MRVNIFNNSQIWRKRNLFYKIVRKNKWTYPWKIIARAVKFELWSNTAFYQHGWKSENYIECPNDSVKIKKLAGPFVFQLFHPFRGYCVLNKSVKLYEVRALLLEVVVVRIWQNFSFHCVKCWKIVTSHESTF